MPRHTISPAPNPQTPMSTMVSQSLSPMTVPISVETASSAVPVSITRAREA
jgi:hypothetical protein